MAGCADLGTEMQLDLAETEPALPKERALSGLEALSGLAAPPSDGCIILEDLADIGLRRSPLTEPPRDWFDLALLGREAAAYDEAMAATTRL
mmetsp:Transcript_50800/g.120709  ORF Transcript_50800/g.120709 Transcript_50800/m.120709 type:complete len:92 (+) Transcript_50800:1368-1643(+)